jgi:protein-disulfide isomerase
MPHKLRPPVNENDHVQGSVHASVELVEYGDYQCPHCGRAYPVIRRIQTELGDALKFVFRNFPLSESHPQAIAAAVAAEAAGRQGAYWEMHDLIFENQSELDSLPFVRFATTLSLDIPKFEKDMADPALPEKVDADFISGVRSGVNGTPSFFINGIRYDDSWEEKRLLAKLKKSIQ